MNEPIWVPVDVALAIHKRMIQVFGGSEGVRDQGLLDSAIARPKNQFLYEPGADLFSLAASYAFGLSKNHPFIDGNKRAAFSTACAFLGMNGWWLTVSEAEAANAMLALASSDWDEPAFGDWLRDRSVGLDPDAMLAEG